MVFYVFEFALTISNITFCDGYLKLTGQTEFYLINIQIFHCTHNEENVYSDQLFEEHIENYIIEILITRL